MWKCSDGYIMGRYVISFTLVDMNKDIEEIVEDFDLQFSEFVQENPDGTRIITRVRKDMIDYFRTALQSYGDQREAKGRGVVLDRDKIAETIANARGWRNGVPTIKNVMDILPQKLKNECFEDADAIIKALTPLFFPEEDKQIGV